MDYAEKKKTNPAAKTGWVSHKRGYEVTQSQAIISNCLKYLIEKKVTITLYNRDYQSGGTIIFAIKDNKLLVDKPRDWAGTTKIRVVFKDAAKLWNHFVSPVISESNDTIFLRVPDELFMLQRRNHFRVETPQGSTVTFRYNSKKCKFKIQDVSAGGMLIFAKARNDIALHGKEISEILMTIPMETNGADGKSEKIHFSIPAGKVMRSMKSRGSGIELFGVSFKPEPKEEARLLRYIRQRELHLLRKAM